ncbi:MAG: chorismate synthase [Candidatus Omnitrophica bacterium]|nr:chorismate synthase [Candidatus Omnitrophota bacterium]
MRILTAGESHGQGNVAVIEGFPKGIKIEAETINAELKRRMSGFGRGKRMTIEDDKVEILSGVRNKITLGSPIAIFIKNTDSRIFAEQKDELPELSIPRPSHADLSGAMKYGEKDVRNILERSSARETVARVSVGAICKQFLLNFGIRICSYVTDVGSISSDKKPFNYEDILNKTKNSRLNCIDKNKERLMIKEIENTEKEKDSIGGIVEVWIDGICPGLGSFMHFDTRLDAKLSFYLMGIPAVKGVEVGLGFEYAKKRGSQSHDSIYYTKNKEDRSNPTGFYRKTNNSGGIEGGISTGEPIILRAAMKPIATLRKPLDSVNLKGMTKEKAIVERSDTCAIVACGVIAESMSAIAITESFLDKFGCDSFKDIQLNYKSYIKKLSKNF